jgi:hypothetical protein
MPKSSWMIPRHHRHRHRKSKWFQSLPIRLLSGLAAIGNGAVVGFGLAVIGDRVRIRVPFGCAVAGCIVVIIASGLKAIGVDWPFASRARNFQREKIQPSVLPNTDGCAFLVKLKPPTYVSFKA